MYLRQRNPVYDKEPADQYNRVVALSTRCMHLGCPVRFVAASARFICPCHGGVYGFDGMVDGGPPVRPLDRFYTEIRGADVPFRYVSDPAFEYDVQRRVPATEKAKRVLGFEATTSLSDMLDEVVPWVAAAVDDGRI